MNKSLPRVTIALPTYNRASGSLVCALESAIAQDYGNIEILISDNASTDNTREVIQRYQDGRIRYVRHKENMLANDNFNFCANNASGEFFLLLHDDDKIDSSFVSRCMEALHDAPGEVGIIRTGVRVIDEHGHTKLENTNRSSASTLDGFIDAWFSNTTAPYCCNTLIRTEALLEVGGFRSSKLLFQDVHTHVRIAKNWATVNIEEILASFRRHEKNMGSSARISDWCTDSLELLDTICEYLPSEANVLKKRGLEFFARLNFGRVRGSSSGPITRLFAYMKVGFLFGQYVAPFTFALNQDYRPAFRKFKHSKRTRRPA